MSDLLMAGSLAAAFAAGMVAFFAPCCAGVMMPAYLAAVGGGHRLRVARLTAVYVAGLSLVAAAAMAASSLFVVSNSLRLRRFESEREEVTT